MRRIIYVAHPLRGDRPDDIDAINRNVESVTRICRTIARKEPDATIFSPIHAFSFLSATGDQAQPLRMCLTMLDFASELWVYGDWTKSQGCRLEVHRARERGIKVRYMGRRGKPCSD